jgi:hypothetical protein
LRESVGEHAQAAGDGVHVSGASYGLPGRVIQVTGFIRDRCEGRWHCSFPGRNEFFGGDPIIGATKQVVVYWDCRNGRNRSAFPGVGPGLSAVRLSPLRLEISAVAGPP